MKIVPHPRGRCHRHSELISNGLIVAWLELFNFTETYELFIVLYTEPNQTIFMRSPILLFFPD